MHEHLMLCLTAFDEFVQHMTSNKDEIQLHTYVHKNNSIKPLCTCISAILTQIIILTSFSRSCIFFLDCCNSISILIVVFTSNKSKWFHLIFFVTKNQCKTSVDLIKKGLPNLVLHALIIYTYNTMLGTGVRIFKYIIII